MIYPVAIKYDSKFGDAFWNRFKYYEEDDECEENYDIPLRLCLGEDGRTICGQVIDVNMVSEPKAHQQGKGSGKAQKRLREESPADE